MATYVRPDITTLSNKDLRRLREGIAKMQSYPATDNRGFLYWAGRHGFPSYDCPHHEPDFLTWHRAYVLAFELALQDAMDDSTFGLPYWDWTQLGTGIPAALSDKTYKRGSSRIANPLYSTHIKIQGVDRKTGRASNDTSHPWLALARSRTSQAMPKSAFMGTPLVPGFQESLEGGHDAVHGWVGGDMGSPEWAAFDPIFWFHHCNIDRLWAVWQDDNPQATYPRVVLDSALKGFASTGADMIDHRALGYDYVVARSEATAEAEIDSLQSGDCFTTRLPVPEGVERAALMLRDVRPPSPTLEVRVFLGDKDADAQTQADGNPKLGARAVLFGHAPCTGADPGHCDWKRPRRASDPRGPHHRLPFDYALELDAAALQAAKGGRKSVDVTFVLVDEHGDPLPADRLYFTKVDLLTR